MAPVSFVVLKSGRRETAPVMLHNRLREEVRIEQTGCVLYDMLPPGWVVPYV